MQLLFLCVVAGIMCPKRGRVERGSSSRATPAPNALTFPNMTFLSEVNAEKYLNLVDYYFVRERALACNDLRGFEEVVEMLQQR